MLEDGEIPFLDADPLHEGMVADDPGEIRDPDQLALRRLENRLRQRGGRSEEAIEEMAAELYNRICESIRTGRASRDQLESAATLFEENPEDLLARLRR